MTGTSRSCGACKFLRRKCLNECVFAPYFTYNEAHVHFSAVHKVFGASNFSRLLLSLPLQHRPEAAISVSYEALARIRDPVYGCLSYIFALQQQVANLQEEIKMLGTHVMSQQYYCDNIGTTFSNNIYQYVTENNINEANFTQNYNNLFEISNLKPEEGAMLQDVLDYQWLFN